MNFRKVKTIVRSPALGLRKVLRQLSIVMAHWVWFRILITRVYRYLALHYISNLNISVDPVKKTILVLNHFYDQDVRALLRVSMEYNLVSIHTPTLFRGAKFFFRENIKRLLAPYEEEDPHNLINYRRECELIYTALSKKFGVNLIVTPADNYYWVRELIGVARDRGVKTVVLDKEGLISPHSFDAEAERIKKYAPFISDHIFVWSQRQRSYWRRVGVQPEDITVIGQPRSDHFFQAINYTVDRYFDQTRPLITFFTYEDDAYIPRDLVENKGLSWRKMKTETQDFLFAAALAHPEYNFIFKAHPQQLDLEELQRKYNCTNVRVVGGADVANELIIHSDLIIAFQTTAVLEAMFMNKRLIYTGWDSTEDCLKDQILPFRGASGIVVARSFEYFKEVCNRFFLGNLCDFEFSSEDIERKYALVSEYIYKPDGHVCERFFAEIERFI